MPSYRHISHAGNFADVVKHVVLCLLIEALQRDAARICVIDCHAGAGRYDLRSRGAMRKGEWHRGIAKVVDTPTAPSCLAGYRGAVGALNEPGALRFYPGSPRIIRALLRPGDRLIATELSPHEYALLEQEFTDDDQVRLHCGDGYQVLESCLPPAERHGLVLLDPTFQCEDELACVTTALERAVRRWPTGTFAVWYPLDSRPSRVSFHNAIAASGMQRVLVGELSTEPETEQRPLTGCGMLVVNAPPAIAPTMEQALHWLYQRLKVDPRSGVDTRWLVDESPAR
ncbi:MAG: hypothetical protein AMJ69_04460 [Gammaproteobacteria bacterium SG8_47]|nr:MAG: hypothetical protein AMJ69_04460 [Gammaproteobacteria bacterium SG8_47]